MSSAAERDEEIDRLEASLRETGLSAATAHGTKKRLAVLRAAAKREQRQEEETVQQMRRGQEAQLAERREEAKVAEEQRRRQLEAQEAEGVFAGGKEAAALQQAQERRQQDWVRQEREQQQWRQETSGEKGDVSGAHGDWIDASFGEEYPADTGSSGKRTNYRFRLDGMADCLWLLRTGGGHKHQVRNGPAKGWVNFELHVAAGDSLPALGT